MQNFAILPVVPFLCPISCKYRVLYREYKAAARRKPTVYFSVSAL